jgi:hypothetical protein
MLRWLWDEHKASGRPPAKHRLWWSLSVLRCSIDAMLISTCPVFGTAAPPKILPSLSSQQRSVARHGKNQRLPLPQNIHFLFNAQHDCEKSTCDADNATSATTAGLAASKAFAHSGDNLFVINMHALHNAALLRRSLPRELVKPIPHFSDPAERRAFHDRAAAELQVSGPIKRAETVRKTKETRLKKQNGVTKKSDAATHLLGEAEGGAERASGQAASGGCSFDEDGAESEDE